MDSDEKRTARNDAMQQFLAQTNELQRLNDVLLQNITASMAELESLLAEASSHWSYEDPIYRFYYGSFKVYGLQSVTQKMVACLESLAPERTTLSPLFGEIMAEGAAGTKFEAEHNREWARQTRPFVEAFFHARFFIEMAVKYGKELETAPTLLPSGWAALLCLYGIR